jgi:hypothetical protein
MKYEVVPDNLSYQYSEYGETSYSLWETERGIMHSVIILVEQKPPDDVIQEVIERAKLFVKKPPLYSNLTKITKVRLLESPQTILTLAEWLL